MMDKGVRNYELMVIFKPLLPDDVRKKAHKTIVDTVKDLGGEVINADVWGKRYLAYPIHSHEEGYYIVYELTLPGNGVKELNIAVKRIPEVLRYLVSVVDSDKQVAKKLNKKVIEI